MLIILSYNVEIGIIIHANVSLALSVTTVVLSTFLKRSIFSFQISKKGKMG